MEERLKWMNLLSRKTNKTLMKEIKDDRDEQITVFLD